MRLRVKLKWRCSSLLFRMGLNPQIFFSWLQILDLRYSYLLTYNVARTNNLSAEANGQIILLSTRINGIKFVFSVSVSLLV